MDVSDILSKHSANQKSVTVEKEIPLQIDAGFLTVTDVNPIDQESYNDDLEAYIQSTARDGIQALFNTLFTLPTHPSPDGPIAQLPAPTTGLPRAKPLPKPKPLTKWQKFAKEKGISHAKKDKAVWDEEKQEWVDRWGWKGKNKDLEDQWLTEVPANAEVDHDPSKISRDARKSRVAKNEKQRSQNIGRVQGESIAGSSLKDQRKTEISRTLATTRVSTASLGRFDKKLDGEKKLKGVKRKFDPTEVSVEREKQSNLGIISKLDREPKHKKARKDEGGNDVLNVRKAVRFASQGKGSVALARKAGGPDKGKKSFKGKR